MKKRFILLNITTVFVALLLTFVLGLIVTRNNNYDIAREHIAELTAVLAQNYHDGMTSPDAEVRLTLIQSDGTVIYDSVQSDVSQMQNHMDRQEVAAAVSGNPVSVIRKSDSTGNDFMYYAMQSESGMIVRVAIPIDDINGYLTGVLPLTIVIFLVTLVLSVVATTLLSRQIARPLQTVKSALADIAEGEFKAIAPLTSDNDINSVLAEIDEIGKTLAQNMESTKNTAERLNYILDNVSDGIIVIEDGAVSLINRRAAEIFGVAYVTEKSVYALTGDERFKRAIDECIEIGTSGIFEYERGGACYSVTARRTENESVILVMSDVTAQKHNEKTRSEFFDNASHELKTPLTSIKGFNELIALNATDATVKGYAQKVQKETNRMLALIDDMLGLSRLEHEKEIVGTEVSLNALCREVIDSLSAAAKAKRITVKLSGDAAVIAEREHMYELVKNLVENGIRYNNPGGCVKVRLNAQGVSSTLTVQDDGIGIDDENKARIFERFFRVDKSRSRETGGTGLGLSIVKHIAELYGARLSLQSKIGAGTTVTVEFPKTSDKL